MRVFAAGQFLQGIFRNLPVGLFQRVAVAFIFLVPAVEMEERAERDGGQVQPQDRFHNGAFPPHHQCGHEPYGTEREGDLHQVAQDGVVQLRVRLLVHFYELAHRRLLAVFGKRHKVVHQRQNPHHGKGAEPALHRATFPDFENHPRDKFNTK